MTIKTLVAAALALGSVAVVPAAEAQRYGGGYGYGDAARYEQPYRDGYRQHGYGARGYYQRGYDGRGYDARRYDGRGDRGCNDGTAGTLIGALAGGLLGRAIDGRGDRALGTVLGAGAGALAGHAVGKSNNPGYCR